MTLSQLIITTPLNPAYAGTTFGIPFRDGQAIVSAFGKPNKHGYSLNELALKFRTDVEGYDVQALDATGQPVAVVALVSAPVVEASTDKAAPAGAKAKAKPKTQPKTTAARKLKASAALN